MELRIVKRFAGITQGENVYEEVLQSRESSGDRWKPVPVLSEADANHADKCEREKKIDDDNE